MSRSGYSDECDDWQLIMWRGAVASSMRGRRGQAFLKETLAALDALPEKKLIDYDLEREGAVCALGPDPHGGAMTAVVDEPTRHWILSRKSPHGSVPGQLNRLTGLKVYVTRFLPEDIQ